MMRFTRGVFTSRPRRWTFLVLTEHENRAEQYSVTERHLRIGLVSVLSAVGVVSVVLATLLGGASSRYQKRRLERENLLLVRQVREHRDALAQVRGSLVDLQRRDQSFRLVAGLEPLDGATYSAGIGGPQGSAGSESIRKVDAELGALVAANALDLDAVTRRLRVLSNSWEEAVAFLESKHDLMAATPSILPTMGHLSSAFSRHRAHPILDENRPHAGIDIAALKGTPIHAAARARVAFVGYRGQYGLMVELDHGHGYVTRYAHLQSASVRVGELVKRRASIGAVGETGLAIGPHLHYEVLVNGVARNPMTFIFDGGAIPD